MKLVAALEYKCPTVKPRQRFLQGWGSKRARKQKTKKSCRAKDGLPTMSSGMSSVWMLDTVVNSGNNLHCTGARLGSAFQTGNDLKCAYGTLYSFTKRVKPVTACAHLHLLQMCRLGSCLQLKQEGWSDMVWIFCEMVEEDCHGKMGKGEAEANWSCEISSARLSEITTPPINEVCYEQQLNYIGCIGRCELLKQNQTSIISGVEDVWKSAVCRRPTDQSDFALLLNTMSTQKYPISDWNHGKSVMMVSSICIGPCIENSSEQRTKAKITIDILFA